MPDTSAVPPAPDPESGLFCCVHGASEAGVVRIMMIGDLNLAAATHARDVIRRAQDETGDVLCDLGYVSFLDLAGLQVLLDASAHARQNNRSLTVANSPPLLPEILQLFRLEGCLEIDDALTTSLPVEQPVAVDERRRAVRPTPATRAHDDQHAGGHSVRRRRDH
jgi:anti-anti-sigma factor